MDGGVLAFSRSVPKSDVFVASSGKDESGVLGEGDGEDFRGVSSHAADGFSVLDVPESESFVPRRRDGDGGIGVDGDV